MKSFAVACEVMVRPLFGKYRAKTEETTWCAESYEDMLGLLKAYYGNKRWKLMTWHELTRASTKEK
jgi:hypothetical protein